MGKIEPECVIREHTMEQNVEAGWRLLIARPLERDRETQMQKAERRGKTRRNFKLWHGGGTTRLLLTVLRAGFYSSLLAIYNLY